MKTVHARGLLTAALLMTGLAMPVLGQAGAPEKKPATAAQPKAAEGAMLIFKNGRSLEGVIVSESANTVRFRSQIGGMPFETDYPRGEILDIKRGIKLADSATPTDEKKADPAAAPATDEATSDDGVRRLKTYKISLEGSFGEDITQTPIRKAVIDAKNLGADVIVVYLNASFMTRDGLKALPNDAANFDEIFRAESIVPIFAEEIPRDWSAQPRVVFWVREAMAGAALLPFVCPEIYFHSEGRMGGLGNLGGLFEGTGDEVVREKQRSLRLGHAEGWAIRGGYDYRLIRAMARAEYVVSVRYVNGKPELFEGLPTNPGEELLTDDAKDENKDTDEDRASGRGNDVLTLDARRAKALGVAKEICDTDQELFVAMGIDRRVQVVPGRSSAIMKEWSNGLEGAKRHLRNLLEDYRRVQVDAPGDYNARTKARGRRTAILNEIKSTSKRWSEGLTQRWLGQNGIPPEDNINTLIEQIKIEQQKDKR